MNRFREVLTLLASLLIVHCASAQDSLGISRIGELTDYWMDSYGYYRMDISGDRAYLSTQESGLQVLNLSEGNDPEQIASISIAADDAVFRDELIYLVDGHFRIINIADLDDPVEIGMVDTSAYGAIALSGDYAFVLSQEYENNRDEAYGTILSIDISDPTQPEVVDTYYPDAIECVLSDISIQNDRMYVSDSWMGSLFIVDISDPAEMVETGSVLYEWNSPTVDVLGDYAFLVENSVIIIDVSDPDNISQLTRIEWEPEEQEDEPDWNTDACGVAVNGRYLYVTTSSRNGLQQYVVGHLRVFDISHPDAPEEAGTIEIPQFPSQVELWGDYAVTYGAKGGITVIDISNVEEMQIIGGLDKGQALGIAVNDGLAYIASGSAGIRVYDTNDPAEISLVGEHNTPGYAEDVVIDGNFAYVSDRAHNLRIIDVEDPEDIFEEGSFDERTDRVFIDGEYAYIAGWRLRIVDISDPSDPVQVGEYRHISRITDVVVEDGTAYMTASRSNREGGGLVVLNVSNPEAPELLHYFDTRTPLWQVALYGSTVYADSYIFDVSEPANPQLLGRYSSDYKDVIYDHYMFTCLPGHGVRCLDLEHPAEPQIIGYYQADKSCSGLAFELPYLYAAFTDQVVIYDCSEVLGYDFVQEKPAGPPVEHNLLSAYPNPFNSRVAITFTTRENSVISLDVFDQLGRFSNRLIDGVNLQSGQHHYQWQPDRVASGEYYLVLRVDDQVLSVPVTLIK